MNHSTLASAQLIDPLRSLALTVEESAPGEFRWRLLERGLRTQAFESLAVSDITFPAYDTALAAGYGELQRLVGPDLQYGPRAESRAQAALFDAKQALAA
ncbi:hypothetical protein [Polaromonas sp. YR568]|uniref:hypothetical protein n=1 Tax=Polaromonas sp. YR568 TaxID=1855301 RepID=UPI003137B26F